jgi:hypothetical protein
VIAWWWLIPLMIFAGWAGWQVRDIFAERDQYSAEEELDAQWDTRYLGQGRGPT